jgi:hypothetical protein
MIECKPIRLRNRQWINLAYDEIVISVIQKVSYFDIKINKTTYYLY